MYLGASAGEESAHNAEELGSMPGSGRSSGEGNGLPTPVFLPGESHGQRSPVGYMESLRSNTTAQVTLLWSVERI